MNDKRTLFIIIITLLIILLLSYFGLFKCPLEFFLGIPCPTCGMTRAFHYLLVLDFNKAFYYHALWPILIIVLVGVFLLQFNIIKLNKKQFDIIITILIIVILTYFIYRHIIHSPVVEIHFTDSFIYKLFH